MRGLIEGLDARQLPGWGVLAYPGDLPAGAGRPRLSPVVPRRPRLLEFHGGWLLDQLLLPRRLRRIRAFHATDPRRVPPPSRTTLVATAYDLTPLRDREVWRSMWPDERLGWHRSIANLRHAAAIVTISRTAMGEIRDLLGVPETRLHLVYPSLPAVVAGPQSGDGGRAPDHLLFVGAPDPHKNLDLLLRALAGIRGSARPRLTVVGPWSPAARRRLEGRAGRIGLRLEVRGDVPDRELDRLYGSVTLLVVPSRREGFGLPILEAMARGCPVVASDLPVLREVSAGAALHVPVDDVEALGNAIESLVADEARRHELAAGGIRRAATFARERWTEALLDCYRSVGIDLAA